MMAVTVPSLANTIDALVAPHFGVIEALERVPPDPDDVPLAVYAGRLANTAAFTRQSAPRITSGAGLTDAQAQWACLGESVERYCAALIPPSSVVQATARELTGQVVSPARFALFQWSQFVVRPLVGRAIQCLSRNAAESESTDPQGVGLQTSQFAVRSRRFPFTRWSATHSLGWVKGRSLASGESAWLPAFTVFQPYSLLPNEPLLAPTISTGLACHSDRQEAVLSGLSEVLERDAIALAWLGRVPIPRVDRQVLVENMATGPLVRQLEAMRFRWTVLDATTEFQVPVFVALLEGHSPVGSVVACGSACHPDPSRAASKALVEAAHCRMFVKSLCRETPGWGCGQQFNNVVGFAEHARLYSAHPEYRRTLDAWWNAPERPVDWSAKTALDDVISRLVRRGYEPFVVDLTSPDIRPLNLHVVRVIVPGLQPLHGNHHWPHLGGSRLRQLRQVFGPAARQPWRWNPWPHPFA